MTIYDNKSEKISTNTLHSHLCYFKDESKHIDGNLFCFF